ncbi:MAG TPA: hypothetical protein DCR55_07020 [Lentisphaeria bacterium]|nr:hypothetical protein [Lentisphaeria bacterium]
MKTTIFLSFALGAFCAAAAEPLSIWISSYQDKQYYENMVREYKKVDTSFDAEVHAFGFMEMGDKLTAAIKTGKGAPDIVQLDEIPFSMFLRGEVPFVDLAERLQRDKLADKFHPQRLALFSQQEKVYGLPQSLSAYVFYYRKDQFEELEISPVSLATWEKLAEVGESLQQSGQALMALDSSFFEILLRQRGGRMFDEQGKAFPDMDLAVEVLTFLKMLNGHGIAIAPGQGSIYMPLFFSSDVMDGEVLCLMGADWYGLDMLQVNAPDMAGKWGIMPLPTWADDPDHKTTFPTATFAGQGLMIYSGSKAIDPSWNFIKWVMTDLEANVARYAQGNSFPAYKPAWTDPRILASSDYFSGDSMGKTLLDVSKRLPAIAMNAKRGQAVFMLREQVFSSVIYGGTSPQEALAELKAILDK